MEREKPDASCDAPSLLKPWLPQQRVFVKKLIISPRVIVLELGKGCRKARVSYFFFSEYKETIPDEILLSSHKSRPLIYLMHL